MSVIKSKAILNIDELKPHFEDESNHYLYKHRDDETLISYLCCEFELVDSKEVLDRGKCGDGLVYDLRTKKIFIEKEKDNE